MIGSLNLALLVATTSLECYRLVLVIFQFSGEIGRGSKGLVQEMQDVLEASYSEMLNAL